MQIRSAKFVTSLKDGFDTYNTTLPEIAVVGRSNVGKSSFINMVTNQKRLSKVSKTPGKTRLVNYFLINESFYLVDLPGYGYANLSKAQKETWDAMMGRYFQYAANLRAVLVLIDIRRVPTAEDNLMLDLLEHYSIPYIVAATKADKIAKSKRKHACRLIQKALSHRGLGEVLAFSSYDKTGKEALLSALGGFVEEAAP